MNTSWWKSLAVMERQKAQDLKAQADADGQVQASGWLTDVIRAWTQLEERLEGISPLDEPEGSNNKEA